MLTHTDLHHFIGAYKEKDVAADIDNIFLSNQGWCYRHYKEELKGKWWDEVIIAGDGRSFDSPGDPNPGFERADGIKDFEYKLGHPPFKLDNVGMIGNPYPVVGVEDHLVARYAGTVTDVVWQWAISGGAFTITSGTLTSDEINVTFDEIKEYTVSLQGSSVQAGNVMIEDIETFHCIPYAITISNPVGPKSVVKGQDAFYGISVDSFAPDVSITWSFDTSDYNIVSGSLNSPAVEVEYTKKGDFIASVNVVSALADTDVTKTINTSVTVPRFDVTVSGPSSIDKGDPATYKMSTIATDGVYSWNITPSDFTLVSGSLSSDEIEVTFDKKGSFDIEGSVQSDYQQETKSQVKTITSDTPRLQLVVDAPKSAKKGDIIKLKATASAVRAFTPDYVYQWTVSKQHTIISGDLNSPELEIQLDTNGQYQHTCLVTSAYLEQQKIVTKNTDVTLRALTVDVTGTTSTEKKNNGNYTLVTNAPDANRLWSITPYTYVITSGTNTTEDIEIDFLKAGAYDISCEVTSTYLEDTKTDNIKTSVFVPNHSVGLSGSSSAIKAETKTYTATSNAPDAVYNWTSPGNTITGSGKSVDITFPNKGSNKVDVEIVSDYLEDTSNRGKSVNVTIPRMDLTLTGPSAASKGETKKYIVNTNATDANINWAVSVPATNTISVAPDKLSADVTWNISGNQHLEVAASSAYHEVTKTDSQATSVAKPPFSVSLVGNPTPIVGTSYKYEVISDQSDITVSWPSSGNYTVTGATDNYAMVSVVTGRATIKANVTSAYAEDTKEAKLTVNTISADGPGNITISGPPDGTSFTKLAVGTRYAYTFTQDGPNDDSTFYSQVSTSPNTTINSNPLFKHEAEITFDRAATTYTIEAEMTGDKGSAGTGTKTVTTANKTLLSGSTINGKMTVNSGTTERYTITINGTATDVVGEASLYETMSSGPVDLIGPPIVTVPIANNQFDMPYPNQTDVYKYYAINMPVSSNDAASSTTIQRERVQCNRS